MIKLVAEARIRSMLAEVYTPEGIDPWMDGRKGSLEGMTPREAIAEGHASLVESVVRGLAEGVM